MRPGVPPSRIRWGMMGKTNRIKAPGRLSIKSQSRESKHGLIVNTDSTIKLSTTLARRCGTVKSEIVSSPST